jgi:hypothetical protein
VIAYASQAFQDSEVEVLQYLSPHFIESIHHNFSRAIAIFSVLASSISTGSPLPPGLLAQSLSDINEETILGGINRDELAISQLEALVVIEVAGRQITETVGSMVETVKPLVGEISLEV